MAGRWGGVEVQNGKAGREESGPTGYAPEPIKNFVLLSRYMCSSLLDAKLFEGPGSVSGGAAFLPPCLSILNQCTFSDLGRWGFVLSVRMNGNCLLSFETNSLLASAEVRERGFIDLLVLDIESGVQILSSHLEWQMTIIPALVPLLQMLEDNL